jgi:hypothetical protein
VYKNTSESLLLLTAIIIGPVILTLQQGIVPIFKKIAHDNNASIFLVLHLSKSWQWPGIVAMVVLGLLLMLLAVRRYTHAVAKT